MAPLRLASAFSLVLVEAIFLLGQSPEAHNELQAAASTEQSGQYEEAAALYQRILSRAGFSESDRSVLVHVRTRLATDYFLLHRYRESLEAVAPLTSKNSHYVDLPAQAWLVDGLDRLELGQPGAAVISLRRTLALNPDSGTARLAMGDALERSGHLEEAVREYSEQTRRTPSVPDAWYKLGLAYARVGTQVSRDFTQRFPANVVGQQLRAEDLLAKGDDLGAAGILLPLVHQAPHQPQVHGDLGAVLLDQGFPKSAEREFRQELLQNPDFPLAQLGLAQIAALRGDWQEAITDFERLSGAQPHELARLLELPPSSLLHQAWVEARVQLPDRFAGSPAGMLWKAWLTDSDTRPIPAGTSQSCADLSVRAMTTPGLWLSEACYRELRDRLRTKKSLTPEEKVKLTEAQFRLGDYQDARREAERALESASGNGWGVYWLSLSNTELAEDCFSKVTSLNTDSARVHQMLADYYTARHYFPRARAEYLAAIQLAPNLADLHLGLAQAYWLEDQWPQAEKEFDRTLELAPGSNFAEYELGDTLLKEGRWQQAADHLRRALNDPTLVVMARLDLSKVEAGLGRTDQAVEALLPIQEADKDGEIHYRLAGLYRKLGQKAQAQEALETFKRLRTASPRIDRGNLEDLEKQLETGEPAPTPKPPR